MESKFDYEAAFRRLEEIAALLERGLPLEESLKLFEEGTKLTAKLQNTLETAEQTLRTLCLEDEDE